MRSGTSNATILKHYRMNELFPVQWEDHDNDRPLSSNRPSSAGGLHRQGASHRRSGSGRYSVLQESGALKRISGIGLSAPGAGESNVPQDEPDPLGQTDSVVSVLRQNGITEVDLNLRFRNKYLISSKTFSPGDFLRDVHMHSNADDLQSGLSFLSQSINQKSSALKQLVSNNFDRFVLAKSTIDAVYKEMKTGSTTQGDEEGKEGAFRLVKEDEWGLKSIRSPLNEAQAQAAVVFGPVLENQGREEKLRVVLRSIDRYREVFDMSSIIVDAIKRKDYETLKEEYYKAKSTVESARAILVPGRSPSELEIHRIIIAERMWAEVTEVVEDYKRETFRRLMETTQSDNFLDLISILLELGAQENPIWIWLIARYEALKHKVNSSFERSRMEIEVLRRRVAATPEPAADVYAHYLKSPTRRNPDAYDSPLIMAFWELLKSVLTSTLSPTEGLLGELVSFWTIAQNFIDGKTQKSLPIGYDESAAKHHHLSADNVDKLRKGGEEILYGIVRSVTDFFMESPIDDVSALVSPIPPLTPDSSVPITPATSIPGTPLSATMPGGAPSPWLFRKPPSTPADAYAFLPPNGNSVASTYYLSQILGIVGTAAAELAKLPIGRKATDQIRGMVNGSRERCTHALCHAWQRDAANFKVLEDWTRSSNNKAITKLPSQFLAVERAIILGLQESLYFNKAKVDPSNSVIIPPANSLVSFVRQQFRRSLSAALKGLYDNAVKPSKKVIMDEDEVAETVNSNVSAMAAGLSSLAFSVDKNDPNVRMLLTLSNLQEIKTAVVPQLLEQFETAFGIPLTEETNVVKDILNSIDSQLFDAYTKPHVEALSKTIKEGLLTPGWIPQNKALVVTPYIHDALLQVVLVHSQVVTTTSILLQRIISFMLESFSYNMLQTFKSHPTERFGLNALLQATLDVEFVNQTLGQYTTSRAQELQSEIYVELDRRSDGPSRAALHKELADLRNVLMGLRRNTRAEFLCFRQKRGSKGPA